MIKVLLYTCSKPYMAFSLPFDKSRPLLYFIDQARYDQSLLETYTCIGYHM